MIFFYFEKWNSNKIEVVNRRSNIPYQRDSSTPENISDFWKIFQDQNYSGPFSLLTVEWVFKEWKKNKLCYIFQQRLLAW